MPSPSLPKLHSSNKKNTKTKRRQSQLFAHQLSEDDFVQPIPVKVSVPGGSPTAGSAGLLPSAGITKLSYPLLRSDPEEGQKRAERKQRFQRRLTTSSDEVKARETLLDARRHQISAEGTNCQLEKHYLRLTSAPERASVRPPAVLELALRALKERWLQGTSYAYAADQLKAMRQDLLVQNVREMLAVEVYETHARMAIEVGDWTEFNQCQSMLKQLYQEQDPEEGHSVAVSACEFAAYRLLHSCSISSRAYQAELLDQSKLHLLNHEFTRHAIQACSAFLSNTYSTFVSLYENAPRMCPYLMDVLTPKLQQRGVAAMIKAYFPVLPMEFVMLQLGINSQREVEELRIMTDAVVTDDGFLDTRASRLVRR